MLRRRSNLGCRTLGVEAARRVVANLTEEERGLAKEEADKQWPKYVSRTRQSDVQPDLVMHV